MLPLLAATVLATGQWTPETARAWGERQTWRAGCNYIPSTAINQLEMWQADTFDPKTIEKEFGLMKKTGMTLARIYLHDLAYEQDPKGFKQRVRRVLDLADRNGIQVMLVFFDDCWTPNAKVGPQPAPIPGVHNSGWLRCPADNARSYPKDLPRLKPYVQDVIRTFQNHKAVWVWDLYNEPTPTGEGGPTSELLPAVFAWAREIRPPQPLTAGSWRGGKVGLDPVSLSLSDVVTFHNYQPLDVLDTEVAYYKSFGRPVICTEWMARTMGSTVQTHLPYFKEQNIPCIQWGLVSGKTNTIYPWESPKDAPEPKVWFHDLYRADGTPFDPAEIAVYRKLTKSAAKKTK